MKLEEFLKNPVGSFLRNMGVEIYGLEEETPRYELQWDNMPYPACLKGEIKDKILLPLQRPEVYDAIAPGKRLKFARNRAQAVLFKGPQGTGKTYSARLIANEVP
ncbi:uncharacterized protein LOC132308662 isoform X2 [Cornus florida]|uniref:uncharacterized protein LOC132308662 isoform X2 n=1 Tax=Cornus florida TaxID=4283 RepID=UPI002896969E|nr:uncharacterized protein LOC132308662 isoform X2 [Cornus florida]